MITIKINKMSVELLSVGNFDYSVFDLTSQEENIISQLIKYDISSYLITKDISLNHIEFFMNSTSLPQDKALSIFSHVFDLLEQNFIVAHKSSFSICILTHQFYFERTIDKEKPSYITWSIKTQDLSPLKKELFNFFHKNLFYLYLKNKLKVKNNSSSLKKI